MRTAQENTIERIPLAIFSSFFQGRANSKWESLSLSLSMDRCLDLSLDGWRCFYAGDDGRSSASACRVVPIPIRRCSGEEGSRPRVHDERRPVERLAVRAARVQKLQLRH